MMSSNHIARVNADHAATIARMAAELLLELSGGTQHVCVAELLPMAQARRSGLFAYIAFDEVHDAVGVITVSTVGAIYAVGIVGTIQELYVVPAWRSAGVGGALLAKVVEVGSTSGWNRIEVGAFAEIGPRLQRRLEVITRPA